MPLASCAAYTALCTSAIVAHVPPKTGSAATAAFRSSHVAQTLPSHSPFLPSRNPKERKKKTPKGPAWYGGVSASKLRNVFGPPVALGNARALDAYRAGATHADSEPERRGAGAGMRIQHMAMVAAMRFPAHPRPSCQQTRPVVIIADPA